MTWDAKHFKPEEFACKCGCGKVEMNWRFVEILDDIRESTGIPMIINSGYRCPQHPIEAAKQNGPGPHTTGRAADIAVRGSDALTIVQCFLDHATGWHGVGWKQHGDQRFIHLDICEPTPSRPRPHVWSYA